MADIVSYNDRESFRASATNSGLQPNPPPTSLVLPKVHLGSFGTMDLEYFQSIGRSPIDPPQARPQQVSEGRGDPRGSNVESFYGLTTPPAMTASPLMRERSMSNEGRVWKPRESSANLGAGGSPPLHQSQSQFPSQSQSIPNVSPTSPSAVPVTQRPVSPSHQDYQQTQSRVDPSPSAQSLQDRRASDSPPSASSPRSLSYLPPGAASPQHLRNSGMAGIGTVAWSPLPSAVPSRNSPPHLDPSRQQSVRSSRYQPASPDPQQTELGYAVNNTTSSPSNVNREFSSGDYGRKSPRITQEENSNDRQQQQQLGYQQSLRSQNGDPRMSVAGQQQQQQLLSSFSSPSGPPQRTAAPAMQSSPYPSYPAQQPPMSSQPPTLSPPPVETRSSQPQTRGGPRAAPVVVEEVCIECMMRDRDMADVDVTGDGVWERESDVWYNELVRKEEEEEIRARVEGLPPPALNPNAKQRPKAKGGRLTEEHLKVWLTLNPKEPQARWQTLEAYLKSQSALLVAEAAARAQTQRESRMVDNRLRESYSQIRRSGFEPTPNPRLSGGSGTNGIQVRVASASAVPAPAEAEKDVTLLENGLIVEHVDLKKEEREAKARMRSLERNERQRRRMSSAALGDGASTYNASIYSAPSPTFDAGSRTYLSNGQPGPYGMPSQSSVQLSPGPDKRMSQASGPVLNSPRPPMQRVTSQASVETQTTGIKRFFGYKHWGGASQSSLAISGSMMDMHLGLEHDRRVHPELPYDLSAPPTVEFGQDPQYTNQRLSLEPEPIQSDDRSSTVRKKKSKGLGKLWKIVTGQKDSHDSAKGKTTQSAPPEEDLSAPLAPPPPLSYLVGGRSDRSPHSRHMSSPSLSSGMPSHPRSTSAPAQSATGISPPTAPSSLLPSPTSNRFPWRDSGSDDPRNSGPRDEVEVDLDTHEEKHQAARQRSMSNVSPGLPRSLATSPSAPGRGFSMEKTLPPLPPSDSSPIPHSQSQMLRPNTFYASGQEVEGLAVPNAPFRSEMRRQSFNGVTQPVGRQTWMVPNEEHVPFAPPPMVGARWDEFGGSRRSLGKFEDMRGRPDSSDTSSKRGKSRSRFFSSLFSPASKKQNSLPPTIFLGPSSSTTLAPQRDTQHARENSTSHSSYYSDYGNARSNGSHNNTSVASWNNRQSVASSKKLALVVQDEDFYAYRYPSHSQTQTLPVHR